MRSDDLQPVRQAGKTGHALGDLVLRGAVAHRLLQAFLRALHAFARVVKVALFEIERELARFVFVAPSLMR